MEEDPLLSIGAFARRSRLSMKALRLYDRLGVLTPAHVIVESGYRRYRESQLTTARLVRMLRRLEMPLATIAELIAMSGERAAAAVNVYWDGVERRLASQRELASFLHLQLAGKEGTLGMYDIKERDVPEQIVLTEQRHVQALELPEWIGAAMNRLMKAAGDHGGPAGFPFVVYHGEINEDSDGPAEACVPIAGVVATSGERAVRIEPAHREAYVILRKAQVEYPQILSAYDAVAQWIGANGRAIVGPPREVYFTDFASAAPNDEVCDVAFPIDRVFAERGAQTTVVRG